MSKQTFLSILFAVAFVFAWCASAQALESTQQKRTEEGAVPKASTSPKEHLAPPNKAEKEFLSSPESKHPGVKDATAAGVPQQSRERVDLFPVEKDGQWGFVDKSGRWVVKPTYEDADFFANGYARVELNGKWGYVDPSGKVTVRPAYDEVGEFSDGLAPVKLDGKWGYIDPSGKMVIHNQYDWAGEFADGRARVKHGGVFSNDWAYIDRNGKIIAGSLGKKTGEGAYKEGGGATERERFSEARDFNWGRAAVKLSGHGNNWGYIDTEGNLAIKPQFEGAGDFSKEGLANVESGGKWGYIDKSGNWVVKPAYRSALPFSEGLAPVDTGSWYSSKWGFVDTSGKIVIPAKFKNVGPFSDGLARVEESGKWGYIDKSGNYVIKPQFSDAWNFLNGTARVKSEGSWVYIDKTGKFVSTPGNTPVAPVDKRHEHGAY